MPEKALKPKEVFMSDPEKPSKKLSKEDQRLWKQYLQEQGLEAPDLPEGDFQALLDEEPVVDVESDVSSKKEQIKHSSTQSPLPRSSEMDRRTEERLRKGKLKIEASFDLHGMTQSVAYEQLKGFIDASYQQNKRCLLVITGKGKSKVTSDHWVEPEKGILKQKLPEWLAADYFSGKVLKVIPAQPQHGGSGAYYVYLRKNR